MAYNNRNNYRNNDYRNFGPDTRRWSREEEHQMLQMLDEGAAVADIADALNRTSASVTWYLRNSSLEFNTPQARRTVSALGSDRKKRVYNMAAQLYTMSHVQGMGFEADEAFRLADVFAHYADENGYIA